MNASFNTPPPFKKGNPAAQAPPAPEQAAPQAAPVPPQAAAQAPLAPEQAAPQAAPVPPQAAAQAPPAPPQGTTPATPAEAPAEKKKQKKNNVMINGDHIKFVLQNIKKMNYTEIAEKLEITKNQVNRILQTLKGGIDQKGNNFGLRGKALDEAAAAGTQAYGLKEDGKPDYSQPVSELAQKVEAKIEAELSRPADSRPGAGRKGGGAVKQALDSQLDELLAGL
jgi:hypothetical protein